MSSHTHHSRSHHHSVNRPHSGARLYFSVEVLMTLLLVFAPFAYGAVEAWSEFVVIVLAGAMVLLVLLRAVLFRRHCLVWSWTYLPMGLFASWAALQLLPLPAGLVRLISPHSVALRTQLFGNVPGAIDALQRVTLSLYPFATRHDLRLLLAVIGVFFVTLNVYRTPESIKRLLATIIAIGAAVAALALAQDFTGATRVYWDGPLGRGVASAGPFIHYSHFGQFMNLAMGAALGLVVVALFKVFRRRGVSMRELRDALSNQKLRFLWVFTAMIGAGAVSILLSGSRGAAIAMAVALVFGALGIARNRTLKQLAWAALPLILLIAVAAAVFQFTLMANKMETLSNGDQMRQRWHILKDLTAAWAKFPMTGTGLGTHEVVFPMFDRSTVLEIATHAENEYAQVMEEAGVVGVALVVSFLAMIGLCWARAVRGEGRTIQVAAVGLGCGVIAILFQSGLDFGQHVAANACLSAVCCALIVSLSKLNKPRGVEEKAPGEPGPDSELTGHGWMLTRAGSILCASGILGWALLGAGRGWQARSSWDAARTVATQITRSSSQVGSNADYAALLRSLEEAVAAAPDNVVYAYQLNLTRWRSISRVHDADAGGTVVLTPQALEHARRIAGELDRLRFICPTYGQPYLLAGQLQTTVLQDQARGIANLQAAYTLLPGDPNACFFAAQIDVRNGKGEDAIPKLQRYLMLAGSFSDAAELLIGEGHRPDLVMRLAAGNYDFLLAASATLQRDEPTQKLASDANAQAVALLRTECDKPDAPPDLLVKLAKEDCHLKDLAGAVECYKRALAQDYAQVEWRMELARILAELNRVPEAQHEVRVCLRLREEYTEAKRFLGELSLRPGATLE